MASPGAAVTILHQRNPQPALRTPVVPLLYPLRSDTVALPPAPLLHPAASTSAAPYRRLKDALRHRPSQCLTQVGCSTQDLLHGSTVPGRRTPTAFLAGRCWTLPGGGRWGDLIMQPACADLPGFEIQGAAVRSPAGRVSHELLR